jgi:FtsH-binding integral membrane protein
MLVIIICFIAIIITFFQSAKQNKENGFKWALIGFIGFTLSFAISIMLIGETFAAAGIASVFCFFVRSQLIASTK